MKAKNSVKILIGLIIVLSISLVYGTSEFIFQNIKLNSPQIKENNKTVVMENPIGEDIVVNNNIEENNDDSINKNPNKNDTSNSVIVDDSKTDDKQYVENNQINNNNNIDNSNEAKNPEKIENTDTKESKDKDKDKDKGKDKNNKGNNNEKGNNNKNNNNGNKKNNDKPILENNLISEEEALEIGFKKVGSGGNLENIEAYLDDNPPKYKIEIIKNKQKYKFEIHARTGSILEYEKEKLKNK